MDAGEGSIDATDDTAVTGDPDISPAARTRDDNVSPGGTAGGGAREPAGQDARDTGYQQRGASGALGPEDVDPASGAPEPDYGPSSVGPAADTDPTGGPGGDINVSRAAKLGRAQPYPPGVGDTNVPGPADQRRDDAATPGRGPGNYDAGRLGSQKDTPYRPPMGDPGVTSTIPREPGSKDMASWKPGSEADQAKNVGGSGDFGVPVGSGTTVQRDYVSQNTRMSDPGAARPRAGEVDGVRTTGAGWVAEGDGAGSEGDIDTDLLGVGAGGSGIAADGPDDDAEIGADASDGTSNEMASPLPATPGLQGAVIPAQGRNQTGVHKVGGGTRTLDTVSRDIDMQTGPPNQGADAATNPAARGDDSFAGEISSGEASGDDLSMGPSADRQGLTPGDNQSDPGRPPGRKDFGGDGE
jgi:hypothetical protein